MNKNLKKTLQTVTPLVLGVLLVWYSLSQISISGLLQYFKEAHYGWIILAMTLGLLGHLSRAYRWRFQLEPLGYKIKLSNSIMAVLASYLINFTFPRAGDVSRATIIANYEQIPFEEGLGTIVAERIADLLMLGLIILTTLFLHFDFIQSLLLEKINPSKLILLGVWTCLILALGLYFIKHSRSKIAYRIKTFVKGLAQGALSIFKMKRKWSFIFHTLFIWSMYLLMFYICSWSLEGTQNLAPAAILTGFIAASFSVAATNGGIGSFPEAIVLAFLLFDLPESPSRAFGWILWTSQTVLIVFFGGLSLILLPLLNRKKAFLS